MSARNLLSFIRRDTTTNKKSDATVTSPSIHITLKRPFLTYDKPNCRSNFMGTNYYLKNKPCETCGHYKNQKHIGKSSYGWQFHFRGYREESIVTFLDWMEEIKDPKKIIVDEYGKEISLEEFTKLVELKKSGLNHCNIVTNNPMTELESKYLDQRNPNIYGKNIRDNVWKDNHGNAFTDCEFS